MPRSTHSSALIRLFHALLIVVACLPLAALLAFFATNIIASSTLPKAAALVIVFALVWVSFMFLFTLADSLMPFLVALSIPICSALAGFPLLQGQWILVIAAVIAYIVFGRIIHRTATPVLALATIGLAYGLYLFGPFHSLFTATATATISWFIALVLCWILLSVALGLIENAIMPPKPASAPTPDPIKQQLRSRHQRIQATRTATQRLSEDKGQ